MAFTYVLTTDLGKVRRDIVDREEATAHFTDEELQSFLDEGGSVKAAAGLALLSWAADLSREDEVIEAGSSRNERRRTVERMKELAQEYLDMAGYKPAAARPSFRQINVDWTPHVAAQREYNEDNA